MKFKQYLINENRSKEIDIDYAKKWIEKNASKSFEKAIMGNKIYRGVSGLIGDSYYIDPKKSKPRQSAYVGSNYYTLMLDNFPSWKKYPKRSQSLICTTNFEKAKNYSSSGNPYIVIIKNNSKIGVCPTDDIFFSFRYLFKASQNHIISMADFSSILTATDHELHNMKISDRNWSTLVDMFKEIDSSDYDLIIKRKWPKMMSKDNSLKALENAMNPSKNGFELKKAGNLIPYDREVWTDGESILLTPNAFEVVSGESFDEGSDYQKNVKISELVISEKELLDAYTNMSFKSVRKIIEENPYPRVTKDEKMVVGNEGAIIMAILRGESTIDVEIEWNPQNFYVNDKWKYKPQLKYKGLEDISSEKTLDYDKEDWV